MRIGGATLHKTRAFGGLRCLDGYKFETRLPPHVHATYVLGLIEAGSVCITSNGRSYVATPGSVVALSPFTVHTELPLDSRGWSFRYLYPSEAIVREALGLPNEVTGAALHFGSPVLADPVLAQWIARVHALLSNDASSSAVEAAFAQMVRLAQARHASPSAALHSRGIQAVRNMLTCGPVPNVTIDELADVAGLSRFHFARVFRSEIGLPPYKFYERTRIAFAHELLQDGHDVSAVAYRLGFADQSHLTRHFSAGSFTTPGRLANTARIAGACGHAVVGVR
jgi:AraC-like DNA-binding protein